MFPPQSSLTFCGSEEQRGREVLYYCWGWVGSVTADNILAGGERVSVTAIYNRGESSLSPGGGESPGFPVCLL